MCYNPPLRKKKDLPEKRLCDFGPGPRKKSRVMDPPFEKKALCLSCQRDFELQIEFFFSFRRTLSNEENIEEDHPIYGFESKTDKREFSE